MKKLMSVYINCIHKLNDYSKIKIADIMMKFCSKINIEDTIFKKFERFLNQNHYYTIEDIAEIHKLKETLAENPNENYQFSSYLFLKEKQTSEPIKEFLHLIKRNTQLIDTLWILTSISLRKNNEGNDYKFKDSILINHIIDILNDFSIYKLFTIENIEKLIDIREIFEIYGRNKPNSFFENYEVKKLLQDKIEKNKEKTLDKNKMNRNKLYEKIRKINPHANIQKFFLVNDKFYLDLFIEDNGKKIGISIFNDRNRSQKNSIDWYIMKKLKFVYFKNFGLNNIYFVDNEELSKENYKSIHFIE